MMMMIIIIMLLYEYLVFSTVEKRVGGHQVLLAIGSGVFRIDTTALGVRLYQLRKTTYIQTIE